MSAGPLENTKAQAPQRRNRLTLFHQQLSLEESCRRVHAFATRYPTLYRWRVTLVAVTACLAPLILLAILAAATAAFPWSFRETQFLQPLYGEPVLRWALIGLVFAAMIPLTGFYASGIVRGLVLRLPEAGGRRLERADAPRLYRMIAEMTRSLDAPAVEEVRISADRVLEIRHEPCGGLGILGRARTILLAGLPLAEELSPQQFRALVAHEIAHLTTHKRRFGGRVLGLRRRLDALRRAAEASALEGEFWSRLPDESLVDMLHGAIRRLMATTFAAVRQHEAEADAIAAAIAGREYAASALLRQRIAGHTVNNQFQQECMKLAEFSPDLPADLFERRAAAAGGAFSEAQVSGWLRAELEVKDNLAESHPPLWDRLRLLGFRIDNIADFRDLMEQAQPHCALGETAARFFLGDETERLRAEFFREWAAHQAADWRKRFSVYETLRMTAAEWERGGAAEETDPAALWQIAVAIGNTRSWRAAQPIAQRILEIAPEHADANMLSGQLLLEDGNAAGIEAMELAMNSEPGMVPLGSTLAARFLEQRGEAEAAARYQKRCEERRKEEQAIAHERGQLRASDELLAPNCPEATAQALERAVERHSSHIRTAYLMRKQPPVGDQKPQYVLGVERRVFPWENAALANRLLLERIMRTPGMPGDVVVCVVTRANRALLARWTGSPHALLFPSARAAGSIAAAGQARALKTENLLRQPAPGSLPARSSPATAK